MGPKIRCTVGATQAIPIHARWYYGDFGPTLDGHTTQSRREAMTGVVEYLLANPIFLLPLLLLAASLAYAILKKLLKMVAIVVIAGALYVVLVEYIGSGL
jgi:hypothetical protein